LEYYSPSSDIINVYIRVSVKLFLFLNIFFLSSSQVYGYKILYAEQFFKLYHVHFNQYPEDVLENIFYLEKALRSDFCNPLNALARIENETEWERYRYLFRMHVNLKLVELYLRLASKYDKKEAYFFNYPWKYLNLESLDKAEKIYEYALVYWEEAKRESSKAIMLSWIHLEEIQYWEDENHRIETGELDYERIINSHLERLRRVMRKFQNMDQNTY